MHVENCQIFIFIVNTIKKLFEVHVYETKFYYVILFVGLFRRICEMVE